MITTDNQALVVYDSSIYPMVTFVSIISNIVGYLTIIICLLGLIGGKLVAIEAAAVPQLVFYSLLTLE